jgi:LmbE family N-acetylglucosaminyl deacetylase
MRCSIIVAWAFCGLSAACATTSTSPKLDALLAEESARVMWVGAHPDDETLAGPLLARACIELKRPCLLFVMTRGEGGRCPFKTGCSPDLGTVRAHELVRVAKAYGAELEHHHFWNAPLPESSFPTRPEIARRWLRAQDPAALIARAIRRFHPTILLTFDPEHGFTGHPEHQLASRFSFQGVRRAADGGFEPMGEPPWKVRGVYELLNHFWITRLAGSADPNIPTEAFDTSVSCGPPRKPCLDVALEITKLHRSQIRDMGLVRELRPMISAVHLREVHPTEEQLPLPTAD